MDRDRLRLLSNALRRVFEEMMPGEPAPPAPPAPDGLRVEVLALLRRRGALTAVGVARALNLGPGDVARLRQVLKGLAAEGLVERGDGPTYGPPLPAGTARGPA